MSQYTPAFEAAINHCMLYEVGGFWNVNHPAVLNGLTDTKQNRLAVGYVNDPDDRGGETKFGVAKNANLDLDITHLTWDQAKAVYYVRYWLAGKCDKLPGRVAVLHFDGCVNSGVKRASMFLQQAAGVTPDGAIGAITIAAVNNSDAISLGGAICDQRVEYYQTIVANNPSQTKYLKGWLRRINEMRAFTLDPLATFD